jgi:hypothetical protein
MGLVVRGLSILEHGRKAWASSELFDLFNDSSGSMDSHNYV